MVLVKASNPHAVAFRYRVEYMQNGVSKTAVGVFAREDADTGLSNSQPLVLGKIDSFLSVSAEELVLAW